MNNRYDQLELLDSKDNFDKDEYSSEIEFNKLKRLAINAEDLDLIDIFFIDDDKLFYRAVSFNSEVFIFRSSYCFRGESLRIRIMINEFMLKR